MGRCLPILLALCTFFARVGPTVACALLDGPDGSGCPNIVHSFVDQTDRDHEHMPDDCLTGPSYLTPDLWSMDLTLQVRAEYVPEPRRYRTAMSSWISGAFAD